LSAASLDEHQLTDFGAIGLLAKVISSGLIVGVIMARLTIFVLKMIPTTYSNIIITGLVLAYGGLYLLAYVFMCQGTLLYYLPR
jgi:CPA1 family monovalent cation:H+ antiporter